MVYQPYLHLALLYFLIHTAIMAIFFDVTVTTNRIYYFLLNYCVSAMCATLLFVLLMVSAQKYTLFGALLIALAGVFVANLLVWPKILNNMRVLCQVLIFSVLDGILAYNIYRLLHTYAHL